LAVLLAALAVGVRAIPRLLTESRGTSNDVTAMFTLRHAVPRPGLRLAPRKSPLSFIRLYSNDLGLFPMFSGMLQQRAGRDRLRLLGAQRE